jgi:hypothetical protein
MAYDHVNECYVEIFKRIAKRGNASQKVLERISKNLVFMRSTWDGLALASGQKKKFESNRGRTDEDSTIRCISYFREKAILKNIPDRKIEDFFLNGQQVPKNVARLYGNLESRAYNACYSVFLPIFLSKMRARQTTSVVPSGICSIIGPGAFGAANNDNDIDGDNDDDDHEHAGIHMINIPGRDDPEYDPGVLPESENQL